MQNDLGGMVAAVDTLALTDKNLFSGGFGAGDAVDGYVKTYHQMPTPIDTSPPKTQQLALMDKVDDALRKAAETALIDADRAASLTEQLRADAELTGEALQNQALETLRKVGVGCFVSGTLVHTKDGLKPIEKIQVGDWVLSRSDDLAKGTEMGYKRVTKTFRFEDKEIIRFVWAQDTADGRGASHSVFATPNHPVWSYPHGWVPMGRMHMVGRGIPGTVPISDKPWWGQDLVTADGTAGQRYDVFDLFRTDRAEVAFDNEEELSWGMGELIDLSGAVPRFSPDEMPYDYEKWGDPVNETRQRYTTTVYNLEVEDWHTYFVGEAGLWVHNTNCENPRRLNLLKQETPRAPA